MIVAATHSALIQIFILGFTIQHQPWLVDIRVMWANHRWWVIYFCMIIIHLFCNTVLCEIMQWPNKDFWFWKIFFLLTARWSKVRGMQSSGAAWCRAMEESWSPHPEIRSRSLGWPRIELRGRWRRYTNFALTVALCLCWYATFLLS